MLFDKSDLFNLISEAKKERIDKQYYITTEKDMITKESTQELIRNAEDFCVNLKLVVKNLNTENIDKIRMDFKLLVGE